MRGIALPINAIVIVAIAVLVLVVLSAFFTGFVSLNLGTISHNEAWNRGCAQARARGCTLADFGIVGAGETPDPLTIDGYDPDGNGNKNTVIDACQAVYGSSFTSEQCRTECCG